MGLTLSVIFVVAGAAWLAYDSLRRPREKRPPKPVSSVRLTNAQVHAQREEQRKQYLAAHPPDRAVAFGYKTEWLAVRHDDALAVIAALGLDGTRSATWPEGTWAVNEGAIFVTTPMRGFVLVAGSILGLNEHVFLKSIVERLSASLDTEVSAFISYRNVHIYGWARARNGVIERMYVDRDAEGIVSEGTETGEEASLREANLAAREEPDPEDEEELDPHWAHQDVVRQLAAAWSVDPIAFDAWPEVVANGWIAEGLEPVS